MNAGTPQICPNCGGAGEGFNGSCKRCLGSGQLNTPVTESDLIAADEKLTAARRNRDATEREWTIAKDLWHLSNSHKWIGNDNGRDAHCREANRDLYDRFKTALSEYTEAKANYDLLCRRADMANGK